MRGRGLRRVEIAKAGKEAKRKVMIGMNHRFRPDTMILKSFVQASELGKVYFTRAGWLRKRVSDASWPTQKEKAGGGVLVDLGIVILDLALWMLDYPEVKRVSADVFKHRTKSVEDTALVSLTLKDASRVHFEVSWTMSLDDDVYFFHVFGPRGKRQPEPAAHSQGPERNGGQPRAHETGTSADVLAPFVRERTSSFHRRRSESAPCGLECRRSGPTDEDCRGNLQIRPPGQRNRHQLRSLPGMKTVLVVDDERDIVDLIRYNLNKEGCEVVAAYNGKEALDRMSVKPDLVLLDLMMPVLDGFETCRRLKNDPATARTPIVFLTASSSEVDEILGLELGAEDYIQKPISPRKLVARVKAVLRRTENSTKERMEAPVIRTGRLEINRSTYTVRLGKKEIFFPKKEFELLSMLAGNPGKVFSREMLLNNIWGSEVVVIDRTVDVHIRKIREKLGDEATAIETVKGVGYRYRE